jgi:lysophospholipid acyltransferase (LPLAT)-like uncharacterized protein
VVHYDTRLPKLSPLQRALIPIIGWVVWAVIRLLGPTIRFEVVGGQKAGRDYRPDLPPNIFAFWHRCIIWRSLVFPQSPRRADEHDEFRRAVDAPRDRAPGIRHGARKFDARRLARAGGDGTASCGRIRFAGFTIDGPRGPRYVAKPGPVMLARRSGRPIILFHVGLRACLDASEILGPDARSRSLSRAPCLIIAPTLEVPKETDHDGLERKQQEMQKTLERVRDAAEGWFSLTDKERESERKKWNN